MSRRDFDPAARLVRVGEWGLMLLGIAGLGIGLLFASGAYVDLDFINVNHLNSWPSQVIVEISFAMMLMGAGPWCILQAFRSRARRRKA
jgi:hypothetical protein